MPLAHSSDRIVYMDRGSFMWMQLVDFIINPGLEDRELLTELVVSDGYAHDFASPYSPTPSSASVPVHVR